MGRLELESIVSEAPAVYCRRSRAVGDNARVPQQHETTLDDTHVVRAKYGYDILQVGYDTEVKD